MSGQIFLVHDDNTLLEMHETKYDSEGILQELLERYPAVLAGDQVNPAEPRQWLLVAREVGVPGEEEGADRWSLDHLFLDQDGIPTLVEVKRSSDTRLRRQVVGQLLDYAANATSYWPAERIREEFEKRCEARGMEPADELADTFDDELDDVEDFWELVDTNLRTGRLRLLFVADVIPTELRWIVEFFNEQMSPAEVLAVELKQYLDTHSGMRTLVPRVVGQTAEAQGRQRSGSRRRNLSHDEFMDLLSAQEGISTGEVRTAERLLAEFLEDGCRVIGRTSSRVVRLPDPFGSRTLITILGIDIWGNVFVHGYNASLPRVGLPQEIGFEFVARTAELLGTRVNEQYPERWVKSLSLKVIAEHYDAFCDEVRTLLTRIKKAAAEVEKRG